MFAAIMEGKTDLADVLFLAAFIVFVVAAIVNWMLTQKAGAVTTLVCIGLALISFAWLAL